MTDIGKISRDTFESVIVPRRGATRTDEVISPTHGIDYGVIDVDGTALVVSTDPISILPALGFECAGRFAVEFILTDVAVSGIAPTHLTINLTLPVEMTDDEFARMWNGISSRARELDVSIIAGHTARYPGVEYSWIGGGTALGVGQLDDLVRPDGTELGDVVIVSGVPAGEVAGLFGALFSLDLPESTVESARNRLSTIETVRDARLVSSHPGVHAVHDVTEGGIIGGLCEMASTAGVRFEVETQSIDIPPDVTRVCGEIGVDPFRVTSAGTLITTVAADQADSVRETLAEHAVNSWKIGRVSAGSGVMVDGKQITPPVPDDSWDAFARFSDRDSEPDRH